MKRLLRSSKYWATVSGFICSSIAYKLFDDSAYALAVLGAFTAVVVGNAVKDGIRDYKNT